MARLDKEKQILLEPERMEYAKRRIESLGYTIESNETMITFQYEGNVIKFFPYSGWASGKGIKDGRGINKLIKQISVRVK